MREDVPRPVQTGAAPSPQSMVATKSPGWAFGFVSWNVATVTGGTPRGWPANPKNRSGAGVRVSGGCGTTSTPLATLATALAYGEWIARGSLLRRGAAYE